MTSPELLLMAYVDGELDPAAVQDVERLMAIDAQARRTVEMYRETAAQLRAACSEQAYVAADIGRLLPRPRVAALPRRRIVWAMAASVVVGAALGGGGMLLGAQESEMAELIDEIVEYHGVFSREAEHLVEIPASDPLGFTAWLGMRLQRRLVVPDLAPDRLQYAGGRMLVVDGEPVAQFMYTREQGLPVAVCVARMEGATLPLAVQRHDGLRVASWRQDGFAYVVVGDMAEAVARDIAARVRAQLGT